MIDKRQRLSYCTAFDWLTFLLFRQYFPSQRQGEEIQ
jgi:hypothetical protein